MGTLAVINTGRRRSSAPCLIASATLIPLSRSSLIKLTSAIPFSIATPNTAIMPIADGTETESLHSVATVPVEQTSSPRRHSHQPLHDRSSTGFERYAFDGLS